jgi:hypothetical protein
MADEAEEESCLLYYSRFSEWGGIRIESQTAHNDDDDDQIMWIRLAYLF